MGKYITSELWNDLEKATKKIEKSVFNQLNKDRFSIILYDNTVCVETTCPSFDILPHYIYKFVDKWSKQKGYEFSYCRN